MIKKIKLLQFNGQTLSVKRMALFLIVAMVCLFAVAFFVPGPNQRVSFMGAEFCGSCHVEEYKSWFLSAHRTAFVRLPKEKQEDMLCLSCHATGVLEKGEPFLKGVQCESCHGPGQHYAGLHIKKDPHLSKLLFMQRPNEDSCRQCHSKDADAWSVKDAMKKIDHWSVRNNNLFHQNKQ